MTFHPEDWQVLTSESQLATIAEESHQQPVLIFKHSTRCGISANALDKLTAAWDLSAEKVKGYYLDLIAYRSVSNAIAVTFAVPHQSPQVLLIKDGKAVYHTSHYAIEIKGIKAAL
ncbi:MAG: bacillithiol system redox-active protein YtxJ [Bacteroidota bacterium]